MNIRLCLIGLVLFLPACQGPRAAGTALTYLGKNGFEELVEVYKYRAHDRQPAPAKLADLDIHEPALPSCYPKLQSGDYVVFWGVGLAAGSEAVLGYEKDVP